jgi:hypothetical protein
MSHANQAGIIGYGADVGISSLATSPLSEIPSLIAEICNRIDSLDNATQNMEKKLSSILSAQAISTGDNEGPAPALTELGARLKGILGRLDQLNYHINSIESRVAL